jgi:predicted nucleic acid-binding protein
VSLYLDASVLVTLFVIDPTSARAEAFFLAHLERIAVSDFGAAEFSSAVARRVRMHELSGDEGRIAFSNFDAWLARSADRESLRAADIEAADRILRRLIVNLRTPDALHIAIAQRVGATLITFDRRMADSARALDVAVAVPEGCRNPR